MKLFFKNILFYQLFQNHFKWKDIRVAENYIHNSDHSITAMAGMIFNVENPHMPPPGSSGPPATAALMNAQPSTSTFHGNATPKRKGKKQVSSVMLGPPVSAGPVTTITNNGAENPNTAASGTSGPPSTATLMNAQPSTSRFHDNVTPKHFGKNQPTSVKLGPPISAGPVTNVTNNVASSQNQSISCQIENTAPTKRVSKLALSNRKQSTYASPLIIPPCKY